MLHIMLKHLYVIKSKLSTFCYPFKIKILTRQLYRPYKFTLYYNLFYFLISLIRLQN